MDQLFIFITQLPWAHFKVFHLPYMNTLGRNGETFFVAIWEGKKEYRYAGYRIRYNTVVSLDLKLPSDPYGKEK